MKGVDIRNLFDRSQLIVVGIAVGMLGCFIALVCVPDSGTLGELEAQLEEVEALHESHLTTVAQLPAVAGRVARMKKAQASYEARVPHRPELPAFLGQVGEILNAAQVKQHEIVPRRPVDSGNYTELSLDLRFETSWTMAYQVLVLIEQLERTSHVASLTYDSLGDGGDRIRVEMCVTVYYTHERRGAAVKTADAGGANRG